MKVDRERIRHAAAIVDAAVASGSHESIVVAAAGTAETLWNHTASRAAPVRMDTIFLLASITKPIVATAVMQLVEQGKLLLDKPVAAYLPEFGENGKYNVTSWNLLTHTSGLDETEWATTRLTTEGKPGDCFADACAASLHFEPGTQCEYNSLSFAVLAELITRLGAKPYSDYLRENVFEPLGMKDTAFRPIDPKRAAVVHDLGGQEAVERFTSRAIAGGGIWSTASDLVKFGQAFLSLGRTVTGHVLSGAAVQTMTRTQTGHLTQLVDGKPAPFDYALGWGKPDSDRGLLCSPVAFGHGGATGTLLWVDPMWGARDGMAGPDLAFVFLTNKWGQEQETPRRVLNAVYGALEF